MKIWFQDRLTTDDDLGARIPISDRAFLLGEGVFETLLTISGSCIAPDRHLQRLHNGAHALGINAPSLENMKEAIFQLLAATAEITRGRLRITFSGSGVFLITHHRYEEWSEAARLVTYPYPFNAKSPLQKIKSTSYGEYLMAYQYAKERKADDALLFNGHDAVLEASTANIIARIGGRWVTPPLSAGPLPGITRELLIEWDLVHEREIIFEELQRCESVALISSLRSVQPVSEINGRRYKSNGKIDELATLYKSTLASNLNP